MVLALLVALLVASGCGGDDREGGGGTRPEPATTGTGTETVAGEPLVRRDAPPAGVARQIDYFGVGDSPCPNQQSDTPVIALDSRPLYQFQKAERGPGEVETGETLFICPRGFLFEEPVTVSVRGPDGEVGGIEQLETTEEEPVWEMRIEPELPRGDYEIEAAEGDTRATQPLTVVLPRHQGVRLMTDQPVYPGTPIRLVGVGLPREATVPIDIYGQGSGAYAYASSIEMATDGDGIGVVSVPTTSAREGLYVFHPRLAETRNQDMDATVYVGQR